MPDYIQVLRHKTKQQGVMSFPEATNQSSTLCLNGAVMTQGTNGQIALATAAGNNISSATTVKIAGVACRPAAGVVNTKIPVIPAHDNNVFVASLCSNGTGTVYSTAYAFDPAASNYHAIRNLSGNFVVNAASTATSEFAQVLGPVPGTENDTVPLVYFRFNPNLTGFGG